MRIMAAGCLSIVLGVLSSGAVGAQSQPQAVVSVPRLITLTGVYQPATGQPAPAGTVVTLAIYAEPTGGARPW